MKKDYVPDKEQKNKKRLSAQRLAGKIQAKAIICMGAKYLIPV